MVEPSQAATVEVRGDRLRTPVLAGLGGKVAEAVTLVLLATVVPRVLGPADYGGFAVALTVVMIGALAMTVGGATLLARYVPAAVPGERAALARALSLRLGRNRAMVLAALAAVATVLAVWNPERFPPLPTALVVIALALNVATTLALQADLGLGRAWGWSARYPVQNAVLVAAVLVLYATAGPTGAVAAIVVAAAAGFVLAVAAVGPLLVGRVAAVPLPAGAGRFAVMQATGGALTQLAQRGGVVVVALVAGDAVETGFAALALGVALAAVYAVVQLFTVSLPMLAQRPDDGAEPALRWLAGWVLLAVVPSAVATAAVLDTAVPLVFGAAYTGAVTAFGPALAIVVLAPLHALAIQAAALRMRPEVSLYAGLAGAAVFAGASAWVVPVAGAVGASCAALAATGTSALVAIRMLPGAIGGRIAFTSFGGALSVVALSALAQGALS
ncbi:MAG: hypothetical protein GEU83_00740 [Pseudonocardiaceae bacterium]|nr:hypothetical protein [Pseudonocardiaceae bacterium]